ncbi:hypothetical protein GBF38_021967 [Nibea albiflora]|uniref:Uncharacterized protein n=1 Tax=Nibea albiflora TaxID=240163 RepID=A0ACB7FHA6_NIBAL|nr:hypothetical protein GBF38_021967 [Nibea albiflora]
MLSCVSTKKTSLDVLVPAATEVVQAIIPPDNQEMCIYKEMASCMENGEVKLISRKLEEVILNNIRPDHGSSTVHQIVVGREVDRFMKMVWSWLNQQVKGHGIKNNRAKESLKNIKEFVTHLPEFTGEEPEEQAPPSTTPEPDVNNEEEDIPVTPTNESKPPSITAEPYVSDDEEDIPVTPTESEPPSITAEPYVSDDEEDISVYETKAQKHLFKKK